MPRNFATMEKRKDALSHFCNVPAIIQDVKGFYDNEKKYESISFFNVTAII